MLVELPVRQGSVEGWSVFITAIIGRMKAYLGRYKLKSHRREGMAQALVSAKRAARGTNQVPSICASLTPDPSPSSPLRETSKRILSYRVPASCPIYYITISSSHFIGVGCLFGDPVSVPVTAVTIIHAGWLQHKLIIVQLVSQTWVSLGQN